MCTHTFDHITNTRFISRVNVSSYISRCQCGFCSECLRQKKSEWRLRAFYEAKDTFKDGFCLFDTFTYRDSELKYFHDYYRPALYNYWDFKCFLRSDVQKFFKRLRKRLVDAGYNIEGKLRYLLTSEYGSVLKTNRPHYHVLFFVRFPIDPVEFSKFISDSWQLGITDGVAGDSVKVDRYLYKSPLYVRSQRVFKNSEFDLFKVTNYVVKYISKDFYVYKRYYRRVFKSFCVANGGLNWQTDYNKRLEFRRFRNQVLPFHFQSLGFGASLLNYHSVDELVSNNGISLPFGKNGSLCRFSLPMFYKRKLFYDVRYFEGKLRWVLNDLGKKYRLLQVEKSISNFEIKVKSWLSFTKKKIDCTPYQLAVYNVVKRGLLLPKWASSLDWQELVVEKNSIPNLRALHDMNLLLYNYSTPAYNFRLHGQNGKFITDRYKSEYVPSLTRSIPSKVFSCGSFVQFAPFDDVSVYFDQSLEKPLQLFYQWLRSIGSDQDMVRQRDDYQTFRYKKLGMLK